MINLFFSSKIKSSLAIQEVFHLKNKKGFTLAELMVALALIGVIATIAIPKILVTYQNQQYNATAKEVAGMISNAYQQAKTDGILTTNTQPSNFKPYFNYVQVQTSGLIDSYIGTSGFINCAGTTTCLKMHSGGVLALLNENFSAGTSLSAVRFVFDPNGQMDNASSIDVPGKAVGFLLYYDGFLTSRTFTKTNTCFQASGCIINPGQFDPSWYSW